jgi:hypothetical protein
VHIILIPYSASGQMKSSSCWSTSWSCKKSTISCFAIWEFHGGLDCSVSSFKWELGPKTNHIEDGQCICQPLRLFFLMLGFYFYKIYFWFCPL